MAKTRALSTETEREQLAGEHGTERQCRTTSRVRARIREESPRRRGRSPRAPHEHAYDRGDEQHSGYEPTESPHWWPDDEW